MKRFQLAAVAIFVLGALSACDRQTPSSDAAATAAVAADSVPEAWMGRWTGPEGTLLDLSRSSGVYSVKVTSLDGPATYEGKGVGDHIEFQRDGKLETIRATNGQQTGMKWLAGKTNCLTIRQSEGFCRD
ncbi:hypothetical protein [Hydrocarboniphaga sp.]|uniref:hypothetical protein n=1 Tax=Hydrocarboniphaga sp. TaxID=2033016 RepID=UPI003D12285A